MNCPTQEQIARLFVDPDVDDGFASHLTECPACQAKLVSMRSTSEQLTTAHEGFDRGHNKARARLMEALQNIDRSEPAGSWQRVTHWIGAMTMTQRISITSAGIAALLAIVALWGHTRPVSAIERMAKNLRNAKSCKFTMVSKTKLVREPGQPPVTVEGTTQVYWLAPNSYRMENKAGLFTAARDSTNIFSADKPGIEIDLKDKTFRRIPPHLGSSSPLMALDKLSTFSGRADRELGNKQLDGRMARGFEIDARKIDPNIFAGPVEIWTDAASTCRCN